MLGFARVTHEILTRIFADNFESGDASKWGSTKLNCPECVSRKKGWRLSIRWWYLPTTSLERTSSVAVSLDGSRVFTAGGRAVASDRTGLRWRWFDGLLSGGALGRLEP